MKLTDGDISDYVYVKRLSDFLQTRSQEERDFFKIGLIYNSAQMTASDLRMKRKDIAPVYLGQLKEFKRLQKKYKFDYVSEIKPIERIAAEAESFKNGHWVEKD